MQEKREQMTLERQRLVHELLDEMKSYEKSHINTLMVERMEKVVAGSLASKD